MRLTNWYSRIYVLIAPFLLALPALGQQAVSPRATTLPSVKSTTREAPRQVTPPVSEVAAEARIPANLFELDDRAIIVVGGKQLRASDVKRELNTELERLSGPPVTARSVSRISGGQPAVPSPAKLGEVSRPPRASRVPVITQPLGTEVVKQTGPKVEVQAQQGPTAIGTIEYCNKNPAKIHRVSGVLTPGGSVTITGECFGDKTGQVLAFGQFAGGTVPLSFQHWSNHRVVAVVPAVKGAADHPVQLTVVRADSKRSPAAQASFVATRERVAVPSRYWTPAEKFEASETAGGTDVAFYNFRYPSGHGASRATPFKVSINQACALDSAEWTRTAGRIDAFNGWESGPPHEANVEVVWTPVCTTKSTNYLVALDKQKVCRVAFNLRAWAQCPVGVSP
jgi:hypothetical protein